MLVRENSSHRARKKLFPIGAAHLIHALAAHEQAVVVALAIETVVSVVVFEVVFQDMFGGTPGFFGIVEARVAEGEDSRSGHGSRSNIAAFNGVLKGVVLLA